ncbi:MAG: nucleoside deaminase [Anaerolineae bacterium]|nr:nucleoside deaminase [Anaerolineae bacterium]
MADPHELALRRAIQLAELARQHGNHPFGSIVTNAAGDIVLEAENTVVTGHDLAGHPEIKVATLAAAKFDAASLAGCTLYASTEPCPMCSGAIYWSGIGRVVFAFSQRSLNQIVQHLPTQTYLSLSCREVFARGNRPIEVIGPLLEEEARYVHLGFWDR